MFGTLAASILDEQVRCSLRISAAKKDDRFGEFIVEFEFKFESGDFIELYAVHLFIYQKQDGDDEGHIDHDLHSILIARNKVVCIEVLFQEFEKYFDIPALFIPGGNLIAILLQHIGNKTNGFTRFVYGGLDETILVFSALFVLIEQIGHFIAVNGEGAAGRLLRNGSFSDRFILHFGIGAAYEELIVGGKFLQCTAGSQSPVKDHYPVFDKLATVDEFRQGAVLTGKGRLLEYFYAARQGAFKFQGVFKKLMRLAIIGNTATEQTRGQTDGGTIDARECLLFSQ